MFRYIYDQTDLLGWSKSRAVRTELLETEETLVDGGGGFALMGLVYVLKQEAGRESVAALLAAESASATEQTYEGKPTKSK